MSVLQEGAFDEDEEEGGSQEPKSVTALSILESLAGGQADTVPGDRPSVDTESVESLADSGERLAIQDDVFELEGLDGVSYYQTTCSCRCWHAIEIYRPRIALCE